MVTTFPLTDCLGQGISLQCEIFLFSIVLGSAIGVFYDCFRVVRKALKSGRVVMFCEDILFFVSATLATFYYMSVSNGGQIRGFILLGEMFGFIIYYFTAGKLVMNVADGVISIIKKITAPILKAIFGVFKVAKEFIITKFKKMTINYKKILEKKG